MAYDQAPHTAAKSHTLSLEDRTRLSLSGVEDVSGFDETLIVLSTAVGALNIRGEQLHIDRIDLEAGQLEVRGKIGEISYDETAPSGSLWQRLFG